MIRLASRLLFLGWLLPGNLTAQAAVIVDFEDLPLPPEQAVAATGDDAPFFSRGVEFSRQWNEEFDCCPAGWAYSNQTDQLTPGFLNSFSAIARSTGGGGFESKNFGVVNSLQRGEAEVDFAQPGSVSGMYVTNVTYAYRAVVDGDDGAGFVKGPFKSGDWFRVEVIGLDANDQETGRVPIYLADFRNGSDVLNDWRWIDLSGLGSQVRRLDFEMNSTDVGPFGMNTPAFFAVDNLTFEPQQKGPNGDFDRDGQLDLSDLRLLAAQIGESTHAPAYDLTSDGLVDLTDWSHWVLQLRQTWFGDADLNGRFDSSDLVVVFQAGKYDQPQMADWAEGDWNADARFDSADLITAFQDGGFEAGVRGEFVVVPEPMGIVRGALWTLVLAHAASCRRRRARLHKKG